ncbi:MAG: glycosyltransferase family 4 protein [Nanoarchaeota archaeon]|nr:glycosyltransferase family 4 protein [Nanoarchaeota archaeon]
MKIAIVSDVIYPWVKGGGERRFYEVYKRLAGKHEIHWYTMFYEGMPSKEFVHEGIRVHCVSNAPVNLYSKGKRKIFPAIKFSLALIPRLLKESFDVIDSNQFPFLHNFSIKFVNLFKRQKFIISWLEIWDEEYCKEYSSYLTYLIQGRVLKLPEKIVSISKTTSKKIVDENVPRKRVVTIPLGVNLVDVKTKRKNNRLLFVGRLIKEKNIDLVIRAVKNLKERGAKTEFIILGEGPEKENLKELVEKWGLEKEVVFLGFVKTYEDIAKLMSSSKLFVLPSEREGFGLVLLEAMSNGCVGLTLEHENNAAMELVQKGRGFILKKDANAWADMIKEVLDGKAKLDEKEIESFIMKNTWDAVSKKIDVFLEGLK